MSTEFTSDETTKSRDAFENALIELVRSAQSNGVDPAGFYESRSEDGNKDFEISVIELAARSDGD